MNSNTKKAGKRAKKLTAAKKLQKTRPLSEAMSLSFTNVRTTLKPQ